jgi:hypothetical protein
LDQRHVNVFELRISFQELGVPFESFHLLRHPLLSTVSGLGYQEPGKRCKHGVTRIIHRPRGTKVFLGATSIDTAGTGASLGGKSFLHSSLL